MLADDKADPKQWLEAADTITRPADVKVYGMWVSEPARKPGEVPPMNGEPLRTRQGGLSVSALLAQRTDQMWTMGAPGSLHEFSMHNACRMALALSQWDAQAAIPVLRASVQRAREAMRTGMQPSSWTTQIFRTSPGGSAFGDFGPNPNHDLALSRPPFNFSYQLTTPPWAPQPISPQG